MKKLIAFFTLAILLFTFGCVNKEENIKIVFVGDQGLTEKSKEVLTLIKTEKVDFILHQGDFDYYDDPNAWDLQITNILGEDFPYFASVGNHDEAQWDSYKNKLIERMNKNKNFKCEGEYGVLFSCKYEDIHFLLLAPGIFERDYEEYIKNSFNEDGFWRICSWHKNQKLMQVGGNDDETGWGVYEECRKAGAIIATGHEHSYSRTHLMENFEKQLISSTSSTLSIEDGKTLAFVSGISGKSIRQQNPELARNPWWASVYTLDQNATYGALFCEFNNKKGYCYFKNINNEIIDSFYLENN